MPGKCITTKLEHPAFSFFFLSIYIYICYSVIQSCPGCLVLLPQSLASWVSEITACATNPDFVSPPFLTVLSSPWLMLVTHHLIFYMYSLGSLGSCNFHCSTYLYFSTMFVILMLPLAQILATLVSPPLPCPPPPVPSQIGFFFLPFYKLTPRNIF